jgi:hypothetical protein
MMNHSHFTSLCLGQFTTTCNWLHKIPDIRDLISESMKHDARNIATLGKPFDRPLVHNPSKI